MIENPTIESAFTRLGRTELIAALIILLIRIKYPDEFINVFSKTLNKTGLLFEEQIIIIISLALTLGLLINLGAESAKIFFNTKKYNRSKCKKIIEILKDAFNEENKIDQIKDELKIKFKPRIKNNPYEHYFKNPENKIIFYNLVRTIGNRYSRICYTDLPEYLFRLSAYYMIYYIILIITMVILFYLNTPQLAAVGMEQLQKDVKISFVLD